MAPLAPEDGLLLLRLARSAIVRALGRGGPEHDALLVEALARPFLSPPGAAFVSLHVGPDLRGCIGTLAAEAPLARTVATYAVAAALEDPRFPPLREDELRGVRLHVSVLSPLRPVASAEAIVLGRHGVSLERGSARAVFLPEVAPEQGWDLDALLENLAEKAGLPRGGWRRAQLHVFETEGFGETLY